MDIAGNWSDPVHAGPFFIDINAPGAARIIGPAATKEFQLSTQFRLKWAASDPNSGLKDYDVRYRMASLGGDFGTFRNWKLATTLVDARWVGLKGYTYCFSTRARDNVLNVSAWSAEKCTAIPFDDRGLTATGSWARETASGYYLGSYSLSSTTNNTLTKTGIMAEKLLLIATKCPGCGTVRVFWNGVAVIDIDLENATKQRRQFILIDDFGVMETGSIEIRIISSGKPVYIDGLAVGKTAPLP
ncbi:MAG: hypothetical protein WEB00_08550 [Dehalococcoidia bacterium]